MGHKIDPLIERELDLFCRETGMDWKVHAQGSKHVKVMVYSDTIQIITTVAGSSGDSRRAGKNFKAGLKRLVFEATAREAARIHAQQKPTAKEIRNADNILSYPNGV